jgi:hypothetical protein
MTPKEKAIELVDKYCVYTSGWNYDELAKQSALIAVDELINSRPIIPSPIPCEDIDACIIQARDYWQEVKQEIEKL